MEKKNPEKRREQKRPEKKVKYEKLERSRNLKKKPEKQQQ